jgi:hypothetical protein
MRHELKCWPEPFEAMLAGRKRHEIRRMDRPFAIGDWLVLREWDPRRDVNDRYTGRAMVREITYISTPASFGLPDDLCVMSLRVPEARPPA